MFSYKFLMIEDLKKIENLRLFTIFHFSWHFVTISKYTKNTKIFILR